jgi:Tfp pilus assembly protein PilX
MKIRLNSDKAAGNALAVGLCVTFVIGLGIASYLGLVDFQSRTVARSQMWNGAMAVAEAGIEDGLQFVNKFAGQQGSSSSWTSTYSDDGWTQNGNVYSVTRYLDAAQTTYYTVYITNSGASPSIYSRGTIPGPSWKAGCTLSRAVLVSTKVDSMFNVCMAALGQIDLKGNGVATDSFDSTATNYPGYWTNSPGIRRAGGDVVTNDQITNSTLNVGNANIAGHVQTGPSGTITIGTNGSVGDLAWVGPPPTPGIKPGWSANDLNVIFNDVTMPDTAWLNPPGSGYVKGVKYDVVFPDSPVPKYYDCNMTKSSDMYIGTNCNVRLNVTALKYSPANIYVAGAGTNEAKLMAFLNGPPGQSCTLNSPGNASKQRLAKDYAFLGLPNCTDLTYNGNGDFTGVMYFPEADFHLAGGGSGTIDFIGSSVTRTVQMNGHYNFHYDESLKKVGPNNGYKAQSWLEVP